MGNNCGSVDNKDYNQRLFFLQQHVKHTLIYFRTRILYGGTFFGLIKLRFALGKEDVCFYVPYYVGWKTFDVLFFRLYFDFLDCFEYIDVP